MIPTDSRVAAIEGRGSLAPISLLGRASSPMLARSTATEAEMLALVLIRIVGRMVGSLSVAGSELSSLAEVIHSFKRAASSVPLAPASGWLEGATRKSTEAGGFRNLWANEGLGFGWASREASGSTRWDEVERAPASAAVPLHAGLGTALAIRELGVARGTKTVTELLDRFESSCRVCSGGGCSNIAFEPLGLVSATLHRVSFAALAGGIGAAGHLTESLFWHGVGRALYLANPRAWPWPSRKWAGARAIIRLDPGLVTASARGFVLPLVLVNIGDARVFSNFCIAHPEVAENGKGGLAAAIRIWRCWSKETPELDKLRRRITSSRQIEKRLVGSLLEVFDSTVARPSDTASSLNDLYLEGSIA